MNRLAKEPSPYLRQHQDNPVEWYPWGDEALQRAKAEDKPILLSVGYSACHWCHVMAHESFENEATAKLMNEHFVNIKLDREERPDLDQIYQGVVQLLGRGGGWPLTVFLTPDLRPFYGGTYFPPVDKHGLPAFPRLLTSLGEAWKTQRKEIEEQAENFRAGLTEFTRSGLAANAGEIEPEDIVAAADALEARVDRKHGGFGRSGPKFPNPMNVAVLLRGFRRSGREALKTAALFTLQKMADGGVYDQLGGGFHRYAVDERWLIPHFEKMLYDNAQLLHLYAEAQQLEPRPLWKKVCEETVAYVAREMTAPHGGFYAAQDADSEGEEGKFFVWRAQEIDALLSADDAALVKQHYGVSTVGNFEHGTSVLEVVTPVPEDRSRLDAARQVLFDARAKRVAPGRDDKVLAGWNGLMIRGLAFAGRVFGRPEWIAMAARAADFVLEQMRRPDGTLSRSWQDGARLTGMLEDYGDVASGLVALYQATFEPKYLEAAESVADLAVTLFWSDEYQAYLAAPKDQSDLLMPAFALHDNAFPSGASTLTEAHVALASLTGRARHLDQAQKYLERLRSEMIGNPFGYGHLLLAADALVDGAADLTVVGDDAATAALLEPLRLSYAPTLAVVRHGGGRAPAVLAEQLEGKKPAGAAAGWICRQFTCGLPVADPAALMRELTKSGLVIAAPT